MHIAYALLVILTVWTDVAIGYPNGKVAGACGDMMPQHDHGPSPDPPPYEITVDKTTCDLDGNITVTLQVTSGSTYFKGFLIEGRDADNPTSAAVGSFHLLQPDVSQLLQCGHTKGSALSHINSSKKTKVTVIWKPLYNPPGRVQFFATVVHKYKVYWLKMSGPVVSVTGATGVPPIVTTTSKPPAPLPSSFSSAGCGSNKTCFREPVGCKPEEDSHCYFLSFTTEGAGKSVMFELSGPAEGYLTFALSLDKWMGNDDVYLCVRDQDTVNINAAYVSGRTHPEIASEAALWGRSWRLSDGFIQCRFHRNTVLPQPMGRFNLNQSYFLFLADGRAVHGAIHRHDRQPVISTYQATITGPPEDLTGSRSPLIIKFHGVIMLIAWMWIVSTGVLFARHFKHDWPDTTLFAHRVWFQVHRGLMVLAVCLSFVAFVLPFIYRGGWSKRAGAHPYLGCIVMSLAVIQPIMALLRPAPESSWRFLFNWAHLGTGTIAQLLAVASVFLGVHQQALLLPQPWSWGVLSGWVLWLLLADLVLLLYTKRLATKGKQGNEDKEVIPFAHLENGQRVPQFKNMVLVAFVIGNTGFLAALVNTITNI